MEEPESNGSDTLLVQLTFCFGTENNDVKTAIFICFVEASGARPRFVPLSSCDSWSLTVVD